MAYATMWLIICGVCLIVEIFTVSFLLFFPGVGAFFAFIATILGANITIQSLVFVITSTLMILFIRPLIAKLFKTRDVAMNSNSLIGQTGIVLKEIVGSDKLGQVKVAGEVWSALAEDASTIDKDSKITVLSISGVKLVVKKLN